MANPYDFKWFVKIPAGHFMAGTHRFKTKKEAQEFVDKWNRTSDNTCNLKYYELPTVQKAS